MPKLLSIIFFLSFIIGARSQTTADYCVQLTAGISENPSQITLQWPFDSTGVINYYINRKSKAATVWGNTYAILPPTDTSFTDTAVMADSAYEYRVLKNGTPTGYGYIYAGIKAPVMEYRGKLLMFVDSLLNDSLSFELQRLMQDISGDGWAIKRFDVSTSDPDTLIKSLISNEYFADSANVNAVLLIGHIAVPYSGDINPDGHPNHMGAWPADVYYANMHLTFTDFSVDDTSASDSRNWNVPGDGKWDQSVMYGSTVELEISRIDLSNMPGFPTEIELLQSYLNKDHAYRMKNIHTIPRSLIDDNFGVFGGEAFAINGWRNFAPLLGDTNIFSLDYISTLDTAEYQWSYACGGGSPTSASGVGSTSNFVNTNVKTIFTMLFGSWFGDWDQSDDFMRAVLCAPEPALTVCWAGRPDWEFHHMALGENIGYSTRLSQNEPGNVLYANDYGGDFVHVALIGDLTLRENIIAPPLITSLRDTAGTAIIKWSASSDSVLGYYVYRCDSAFGIYTRLDSAAVTDTVFTDVPGALGLKYYMVRALRLENTPSGTYYNLSEGVADTLTMHDTVSIQTANTVIASANLNFNLHPIPVNDLLTLEVSLEKSQNFSIKIFDVTGALLSSETYNTASIYTTIDVSSFASGTYFCQLISAEVVISKKFEVVR